MSEAVKTMEAFLQQLPGRGGRPYGLVHRCARKIAGRGRLALLCNDDSEHMFVRQ